MIYTIIIQKSVIVNETHVIDSKNESEIMPDYRAKKSEFVDSEVQGEAKEIKLISASPYDLKKLRVFAKACRTAIKKNKPEEKADKKKADKKK